MTQHDPLPGQILGHEPGAFYNRLARTPWTWNPEKAAGRLTRERLRAAHQQFLGRDRPGR